MITTLKVKCPHCQEVSEIFLSTAVSVIILNCPSCLSPIMYFGNKIFLLDPEQLKKIKRSSSTSVVSRLLEQLAGAETAIQCPAKKSTTGHLRRQQNVGLGAVRSTMVAVGQTRGKRITADDCTNLRIELELCNDANTFIERL
jgi:hypothetical protein